MRQATCVIYREFVAKKNPRRRRDRVARLKNQNVHRPDFPKCKPSPHPADVAGRKASRCRAADRGWIYCFTVQRKPVRTFIGVAQSVMLSPRQQISWCQRRLSPGTYVHVSLLRCQLRTRSIAALSHKPNGNAVWVGNGDLTKDVWNRRHSELCDRSCTRT